MAWIPAAGSIVGGLLGNKGAQKAADTAAQSQQQIAQQEFQQATQYDQQQQNALRSQLGSLIQGGNPFFQAGGAAHPTPIAPGQGAHFGATPPPGTFQMPQPGTTPRNAPPTPGLPLSNKGGLPPGALSPLVSTPGTPPGAIGGAIGQGAGGLMNGGAHNTMLPFAGPQPEPPGVTPLGGASPWNAERTAQPVARQPGAFPNAQL